MLISRNFHRRFLSSAVLRASLMVSVAVSAGFSASPAIAAAPMVKTSAPAYYRAMLGDFEITVLSDGVVPLPVDKLLSNTKPEQTIKSLTKHHLQTPVATSVNGFLINTGSKLVLVDTGAASLFGPTLGRLAKNLKASGYSPEQVDEIYITHMHGDHVGGLMEGDTLVFPNAIVRADQAEADFWLSQANLEKAPAEAKGAFQGAMKSVNPYVKAGKFKGFSGTTQLVEGISAIPSHGHTAGHSKYLVESKGQKLMLWGDLMHVASVQFEHPEITISFDTDSNSAKSERQKAYAEAAKQGYMVGATHLSFPGLGYLRSEGKGYVWMPLNYQPVE